MLGISESEYRLYIETLQCLSKHMCCVITCGACRVANQLLHFLPPREPELGFSSPS